MRKIFVALCSPSAGGKTTLANMLIERDQFTKPEHFTTRSRREGEEKNSPYTHISEEEFISRIKDGGINIFTVFNGKLYGYNASNTLGDKSIFVIEPKGIAHLERYCIENKLSTVQKFQNDGVFIKILNSVFKNIPQVV